MNLISGEDHAALFCVWQDIRQAESAEEAHENSHRGEATHLSCVQQGVFDQLQSEHSQVMMSWIYNICFKSYVYLLNV